MTYRPALWPFPIAFTLFAVLMFAAFWFAAPGLFFAAWLPVMWFLGHLWHCFRWGSRYLNDIEGAFR